MGGQASLIPLRDELRARIARLLSTWPNADGIGLGTALATGVR